MKKLIVAFLCFSLLCVNAFATDMLIPMGSTAGIKIMCDGVMVSSVTQVQTQDGPRYPAKDAGIIEGDIIKSIDGKEVLANEQIAEILENVGNNTTEVSYERDGEIKTSQITPVCDISDGNYKIGIWVRDSIAGIGTITYVDPETLEFGALGHSISEVDSGKIMPIKNGELISSSVADVVKGEVGSPGQLQGEFDVYDEIGDISLNSANGIFGNLDVLPEIEAVEIGSINDVYVGSAYILSNIDGTEVSSYEIEILDIVKDINETRNFIIRVTDEELLEKTGGIVQGMSGSPILQDGKIIGAVTHVLVNQPSEGYGIAIENMLSTASTIK